MKKITRTECASCGTEGPEGELVKGALEAAAVKGWLIGDRPHSRKDYCPACRPGFEPVMCAVPHTRGFKQSTAIYKLTVPDQETEVYTCGVHAQQIMRELFNSGADSVLTAKTTSSRRGSRNKDDAE